MGLWSVRSCRSLRRRWSPSGGFWLRPPWSSTTPSPPASYPRPQKYIISSTSETSPRWLTSCIMCDCLSSRQGADCGLGTPSVSIISDQLIPERWNKAYQSALPLQHHMPEVLMCLRKRVTDRKRLPIGDTYMVVQNNTFSEYALKASETARTLKTFLLCLIR